MLLPDSAVDAFPALFAGPAFLCSFFFHQIIRTWAGVSALLAPVREEALVSVRSRAEGTPVLSTTLRISKGSYGSNSRGLLRICGWGRGPLRRLRWSGGWITAKVPLPSPACAREVLCAAAGLLFAVLASCSCPLPPSFLALFPPPRLGRYVVLHFCPPPRFHICGLGLLRRYQPCAGRSLVFISFLFSTRARQIRTCRAVPC